MSCANGKNREAEKWPKSPVQIRNARQSQSSPTGPSSNHLPLFQPLFNYFTFSPCTFYEPNSATNPLERNGLPRWFLISINKSFDKSYCMLVKV
jgi:hypothetical protein